MNTSTHPTTVGQGNPQIRKILVAVKRVPDSDARVRLKDGRRDLDGVSFVVNPFDAIALEEAVRLKEKGIEAEVVAVSIGALVCEEQLRTALAMGADRAIVIVTDEALDSLVVAKLLAQLCERERPDLVLMGKQAVDDDSNQAGQMLAGLRGCAQATFVSKLEIVPGGFRCHRETDAGIEITEVTIPSVVTVDLRLNEPRYVSLPSILKAKKKPMERLPAANLATDAWTRTTVVRLEACAPRAAGIRVKTVEEFVAALRNATGLV